MAKNKVHGICLYCGEHSELQRSHAINRTFFNALYKACGNTNSAKVIKLSSDVVINSNDNWTDYLLCRGCESYFNEHFDGYGANALRGKIKGQSIRKTKGKVIYQNIDTSKMLLYILSLYWRGAHSSHSSYDLLIINEDINSYLKYSFKEKKWSEDLKKCYKVKISILYDSLGVFCEEGIKQIMVSPFRKIYNKPNTCSFCFLFEGFLIEIYLGQMTYSLRKKGEWVVPNVKYMKCEMVDINKIPELQRTFVHTFVANRNMRLANILVK